MRSEMPDTVLRDHGVASVLVVDDDEAIRETIKSCLEDHGYSAAVVADGQQALDYLEAVPVLPKLILLDLMMPIMNGWDLLNRLRMSKVFVTIPLVIISAHAGRGAPGREASAVPVRVLHKPLNLNELLGIVREACTSSASARG